MTIAAQIAEQFGDDGQRWQDDEGRALSEVCKTRSVGYAKACSRWDYEQDCGVIEEVARGESAYDLIRYVFEDGSAIVITDGGWDIEGAEPFSWAGA